MALNRITDELVELSAQHVAGETVEEDDRLLFFVGDEENGVEITHDIGDPEKAAQRLVALSEELRAHADRIRYRARLRSAGWT